MKPISGYPDSYEKLVALIARIKRISRQAAIAWIAKENARSNAEGK